MFFSLMISGLASSLPPVSTLFATFLGENPIQHLLGPTLAHLSAVQRDTLTGFGFSPGLVSGPFHHGLAIVFGVATAMALISAVASALRGRHQRTDEPPLPTAKGRQWRRAPSS